MDSSQQNSDLEKDTSDRSLDQIEGNETSIGESGTPSDRENLNSLNVAKDSQGVSSVNSAQNSQIYEIKSSTVPHKIMDIEIVSFSPEMDMKWNSWLAYFDAICLENKRNNVWKIKNIQNFIKGRALTLYINNCLNILHWEELVELFNEEFHTPGEPSLGEFSDIKFNYGADLNQYYQRKVQIGRALGLESSLILEGLTDGLPIELRQLVVTNAPKNTSEWRELVFKLNKLKLAEKNSNNTYKRPFENQNPNYFRQWRPQRQPNPNYVPQSRFQNWTYRAPNMTNPTRTYHQNIGGNNYRQPRPSLELKQRQNVHYNESMSPAPCRICLNMGIPNAYHWVRNCPFKRQSIDQSQIMQNTSSSQQERPLHEVDIVNPQSGSGLIEGASNSL